MISPFFNLEFVATYTHKIMESLIACFNRQIEVSGYSQRGNHYDLRFDEVNGCVVTMQPIPANSCIGEIYGVPAYIWDMTHGEYVFIDEDMVLDVSGQPKRQILSLIRENNQTNEMPNCELIIESDEKTFHCYVVSTRPIQSGDEIVYVIPHM